MANRKCVKKYPRQPKNEIETNEYGYPLYKLRKPEDMEILATIKMRKGFT